MCDEEPIDMAYTCPVCGYPGLDNPPRSFGVSSVFEICSSCGFEFGYTDDALGYTFAQWREKWIDEGMPWSDPGISPPTGWDPAVQLRSVKPIEDG
jgi:hypothetical protein